MNYKTELGKDNKVSNNASAQIIFNLVFYIIFRHIKLAGEYKVAGTQALYERTNELEKIRIPGSIKEPILIYVCLPLSVVNLILK